MKRSKELMCRLLLKIEELPIPPGAVVIITGYDSEVAIDGYSSDAIEYHLGVLRDEGFLDVPDASQPMQGVMFKGLSSHGHDALDEYRKLIEQQEIDRARKEERAWISAADAVELLRPVFNSAYATKMTICKRAHSGLIRARAEKLTVDDKELADLVVPKGFWWAEGHEALTQNWHTGDFDTWEKHRLHWEAFGVRFFREHIEKLIPATAQVRPTANTNRRTPTLFPIEIIEKANRSYLTTIAHQMNGCFDESWFDACAVMMRRLLEAVIIEAYEARSIADRIKDTSNNYLQLTALIDAVLQEKQLSLSRGAKAVLPKLRDVGHRSAHGRFFTAQRSDLEKIQDGARVVIEEFLHHAGLI